MNRDNSPLPPPEDAGDPQNAPLDLRQGAASHQSEATQELLGLSALTPAFNEDDHGVYVREIQSALDGNQIRNIALSGNYGVGKSSILKRIVALNPEKIVEISLSALSPVVPDANSQNGAYSTTNQIQQEIVKQLLYREKPSKTPGSRFRRIQQFQPSVEIPGAMLVGVIISLGFLLSGWSAKIALGLDVTPWGPQLHLAIFAAGSVFTYATRSLVYGRLNIKQLSAGPATVTLDEQSRSYFDQYLDEIFYFFEVSEVSVVVFEDIDRFDDPHIFETLRALNTLLNTPAVNQPVRFIYAMKDSIFERLGESGPGLAGGEHEDEQEAESNQAHREALRANRTKFFDLVIPVVPFITHHNAKNVVVQLLAGPEFDVDEDLIDLVSRHVPDMRLLKNVRNEFLVFRNRILSGAGAQLRITDTELFAMMLYKATHLTDFENIRLGGSALDKLYRKARGLISDGMRAVARESTAASRRLSTIDSIADRSGKLGQDLKLHAQRVARANSWPLDQLQFLQDGVNFPDEDLEKAAFWHGFLSRQDDPSIEARVFYRGSLRGTLTFLMSDLNESIGPFSAEQWKEDDRAACLAQLAALDRDSHFLRGADVHDLCKRPDFSKYLATEGADVASVARKFLPSTLAFELVRAGHINRNFALCTAIFHGTRVTSAATNFMVHHVQRGRPDIYFQLAADDVEAIIREAGESSLSDPTLYNICLLDHLLSVDAQSANALRMITSMATMESSAASFMQAYISNGKRPAELFRQLASVYEGVFSYLVSSSELDDRLRAELASAALLNLDENIDYTADAHVRRYLNEAYSYISSLTEQAVDSSTARKIAWLFSKAQAKVRLLEPLSAEVTKKFVALSLYEINHANLTIVNDGNHDLALDSLSSSNGAAYKYVLRNLPVYLSMLQEGEYSVSSADAFPKVLLDAGHWEQKVLRHLVQRASKDCIVEDLSIAPLGSLPVLVSEVRCPATLRNVLTYLKQFTEVDDHLAVLLTAAGGISVDTEDDVEGIKRAALAVLRARDLMPAKLRATIVGGMDIVLSSDELPIENGELFSLLVKHRAVEDGVELYRVLAQADWRTRELYIAQSRVFADYLDPDIVGGDLRDLMRSQIVPLKVKNAVIARADEFSQDAHAESLSAVASYAATVRATLSLNLVLKLPSVTRPSEKFVALMAPHLNAMTQHQITGALAQLGRPYVALSAVGKDNPVVANTPDNLALLARLQQLNIVSTWKPLGDGVKVFKKRK